MTNPEMKNSVVNPSSLVIIDPEQLHLEGLSENETLIEVSSYPSFIQGHIAQAHYLPWQATLNQGPLTGLPPPDHLLDTLLDYLDYNPQRHYWVYDDEGGGWAGRLIWLLQLVGHQYLGYVDGGKIAWRFHRLPLATNEPTGSRGTANLNSVQIPPLLEADHLIQDLAGDGRYQYWDARSSDEYHGRRVTAIRNGHIPGALHLEWTQLMDQNRGFKIRQDARDLIIQAGLDFDKPCVTYCHSNHRSGFTFLVGSHLNMTIQPYPGAWSEWGNRDDTPVQ